jgi:hypothetical protein
VLFRSGVIALVLGLHGVSAFGEEIPAGQSLTPEFVQPAKGASSDNVAYVDRSHAYLDRNINEMVGWFDGLFGAKGGPDAADAKNELVWAVELRTEKGKKLVYRFPLRAHLRLPKLEKKIRLVIIEENRLEAVAPIPSEPGTPIVNTPTEANTLRAVNSELRYYARETKAGYVFVAAGSRFSWLPETFVRARSLWRHPLGDNSFISPSATPFWQDHIGFGVTPQLDFGHTFADSNIFLWTNSATVFKKRSGVLWGTEASLSRILSPVTAVAIGIGASGSTRPSAVADRFNLATNNYKIAARYRRSVYRPWLFVELIPEMNWRREDPVSKREFIPALTARLEINSLGPRALVPIPLIVKEQLPVPIYESN